MEIFSHGLLHATDDWWMTSKHAKFIPTTYAHYEYVAENTVRRYKTGYSENDATAGEDQKGMKERGNGIGY